MRKLFLLCFLLPIRLWACDCPTLPLDSAYARANVVFVGTCMNVAPNPIKGDFNIVFQVDSSWKRQIEPVATIHTPSSNCRFDFKPGKKYLVVGYKRHQTIHTDACATTMLLPEVLPTELGALGKAYQPGAREMIANMKWLLIALGAGGILFVALVVLRKRIWSAKK